VTRGFAALLPALFSLLGHAAEYAPVTHRPVPVKVSAHGYYVQGQPGVASAANEGFNSNAGFVVTAEGVVVIDALGTRSLGYELIRAIRQVTSRPIRRVIVTHYHADHVYGLQAFKAEGAEIWAHRSASEYLQSEGAARLAQRRKDLAPWVDDETHLVPPDRVLDGTTTFKLGGLTFDAIHMGPAHAPDDLVVVVREEGLLYAGDIMFSGRIPFVGNADSGRWLETSARLLALKPRVMVPGHGKVSNDPARDLELTREYLIYLRSAMRKAVDDLMPFEQAYTQTDWSRFAGLPAFDAANRINAYGTYLLLEREALKR
jgi:glyoxylase-like metal-dependent hydrolase (beta-lactamase superfamily II)